MNKVKKVFILGLLALVLVGAIYFTGISKDSTAQAKSHKGKVQTVTVMYEKAENLTAHSDTIIVGTIKNINAENKLMPVNSSSTTGMYKIISEMEIEVISCIKGSLENGSTVTIRKIIGMRSKNQDFLLDEVKSNSTGDRVVYFLNKDTVGTPDVYYPASTRQAQILIDSDPNGKTSLINNADETVVTIDESAFPMFKDIENLGQLEKQIKEAVDKEGHTAD